MDFSNVHILLCDHDPSTGTETLSLLQKCSYKVTPVKTARQVVDVLQSESSNVDVVLTDVELPKGEGFKMLKYLLRRDNLGHVPVVVMSEHDEMAVVAKCLSLGAVDYLVKPLRLNEVMNLWTHMWRKRRLMKLPDKQVGILSSNGCPDLLKPGKTVDLLSGYNTSEALVPVTDAWHTAQPEEHSGSQVELSLRLSLSCKAGKQSGRLPDASLSPHPCIGDGKDLASSTYLRPCHQQPDEQSATNACSSSNAPSKRPKYSSDCITNGNQDAVSGGPVDASRHNCKETSGADETRLMEGESQMPDTVYQSCTEQVSPPFISSDEMICHGERTSPLNVQGFRPWYALMGWPPSSMQLGETASVPEAPTQRYELAVYPPPGQAIPIYYHDAGVATMPPVPNVFPCYTVAHLAVPVVNFPTWPAIASPPPLVGGKLIQAERREAALSKFRMKRKGRCFEKKIRYASRKKLAEQRPRVRGQFVKRTVLLENVETQAVFDEEGEADDEEGCSEVENQSSLDCVVENSNGG